MTIIRRLILGFVIAMSCRTFQYFPGMAVVQEGWFITCVLYLLTVYLFFKVQTGWHFLKFEQYILMLMVVVPLLSAYGSWQQFGQPLSYGLLAQRGIVLLAGSLMVIDGFRHHTFTLKDLENTLLGLGWTVTIVHLLMRVFLNPADYLSYGQGFVMESPDHMAFVIPQFFPAFVLFYYAFRGFRTRRPIYYCFVPVFVIALLNNNGARAMTASLMIAFLILIYRWSSRARATALVFRMVVLLTFALGSVYLISPETFTARAGKFADAYTVAFTGQEVQDLSATLRIFEAAKAVSYIPQHPFVGNGIISHQWGGGFDSIMGEYFNPSDIGLLGVVYAYGAIGFLIFSWQYIFVIKTVKQQPAFIQSPLLDAIKGVLLFMAINAISASYFVFFIESSCIFIAVLVCISLNYKRSPSHSYPLKLSTVTSPRLLY